MSVKKTGSPLSSGAESLDPLGGREDARGSRKTDKNFETALAQLAGEVEQAGGGEKTDNPTRAAFQQIAQSANLETAEGALSAVRDSANFLVKSRLKADLRDSDEGIKVAEDLSGFITKDPFLNRKILGILKKLQS